MLHGLKTKLIPFEPDYGASIAKWKNDPTYKYYFRNMPEELNNQQLAMFSQYMNMNVLMIIAEDKIIGMATWDGVRILARTCCLGFLIDKDFQNKGYTKDAFMTFVHYLTSRLGFHKIIAAVAADENETQGKVLWGGFQEEGLSRDEFFLDGRWQDEIRFAVIDHDFKKRYEQYLNGKELNIVREKRELFF